MSSAADLLPLYVFMGWTWRTVCFSPQIISMADVPNCSHNRPCPTKCQAVIEHWAAEEEIKSCIASKTSWSSERAPVPRKCRPKCKREKRTLSVLMQRRVIKTCCSLNRIGSWTYSTLWHFRLSFRQQMCFRRYCANTWHCSAANSKRDHVTCMRTFGFLSRIFQITEQQYFKN